MGKRAEHLRYEQRSFPVEGMARPPRRLHTEDDIEALHKTLEEFVDLRKLRRLASSGQDIFEALRTDTPPREVRALLDTVVALLRPVGSEQVKSPQDVASLLMAEMGHLDQEELRTVLLDTRNRVQDIVTVYKGSVNATTIRISEVYQAAVKRNSPAIIVAHNHPSGLSDPSPEDVFVTRQIVEAGALLDISCLDHLIIGRGNWTSLRERGLGFEK